MLHLRRSAPPVLASCLLAALGCAPGGTAETETTAGAEQVPEATPHYPGPCTVQVDFEVDGTVDEVQRFAYDARGMVTREETDSDADGTADSVITHTYDAEGHRVRSESDRDGDGSVDASTTYVFEAGRLVREETDEDGDGHADSARTTTYDEQGRAVREESDTNGDGRVDQVAELTYDAATGLVQQRDQGFERRAYEHDPNGRLVREVISSRTRARRQYRVQSVVKYEYDEAGRRTLEQYETPRGEVTTFNRYQFDAQGSLVRLESDSDVTTSVITYDEAGNRLREEMDEVGEKSLRTYAYDCF